MRVAKSKMPSKAQGLSLNTIIIAAVVLIVLLILVGLLTGFFGKKFGPDFRRLSDTSCNGEQIEQSQTCPAGTTESYAKEVQAGKKCCQRPGCGEVSSTACRSSCITSGCTSSGTCETEKTQLTPTCGSGMKCCGPM